MNVETLGWIDTHCHLHADVFSKDGAIVRAKSAELGVKCCVLPAVCVTDCGIIEALARRYGDAYAVGIHPISVPSADYNELDELEQFLQDNKQDQRLVAIGEIGLDFYLPELCTESMRAKQLHFYHAQLRLAQQYDLPVILHVRRAVDVILHGLRQWQPAAGIAHAFNGSLQQAKQTLALGLRIGFGGAVTYERAKRLHDLVRELPIEAIVLETDSPDMPPSWLYAPKSQQTARLDVKRNTPSELPRIAQYIARLRGNMPLAELSQHTLANSVIALPKLANIISV